MKDNYLISYELFCLKKKFSLEKFLKSNKDISYNDLQNFFRLKSVTPPEEEIFLKIKKVLMSKELPTIENKELPTVIEKKEKDKVELKKDETKKVVKRRRRRKTKND